MAKINIKEIKDDAKKEAIVKMWGKLNDALVNIGADLSDAEVEFVKQMMQQREAFMITHAGYRKVYNGLSGKEELVK